MGVRRIKKFLGCLGLLVLLLFLNGCGYLLIYGPAAVVGATSYVGLNLLAGEQIHVLYDANYYASLEEVKKEVAQFFENDPDWRYSGEKAKTKKNVDYVALRYHRQLMEKYELLVFLQSERDSKSTFVQLGFPEKFLKTPSDQVRISGNKCLELWTYLNNTYRTYPGVGQIKQESGTQVRVTIPKDFCTVWEGTLKVVENSKIDLKKTKKDETGDAGLIWGTTSQHEYVSLILSKATPMSTKIDITSRRTDGSMDYEFSKKLGIQIEHHFSQK